jgi:hypothetical protein
VRNIQEGLVLKKEDKINNLRGNQKHPKKQAFFWDPALPAALWSFTNIDKNS